jgi:hypothetical protein
MKLITLVLLVFFITLLILHNQLILAGLCTMVFSWRTSAAWLIPVGMCIDAYFGAFVSLPVFSIVATFWWLLSEYIKPRLLVHYKYE